MGGRTPCPLGPVLVPRRRTRVLNNDRAGDFRRPVPRLHAGLRPTGQGGVTPHESVPLSLCAHPPLERLRQSLAGLGPSLAIGDEELREQVAAAPRCSSPLNASRKTDTPENQPLPAGAIGYSLLKEHTTSLSDGGRKAWSPCRVRREASEARVP